MSKIFKTKEKLPEGWQWVELGKLCQNVYTVKRKEKALTDIFFYLDIGGIDNLSNIIVAHKEYNWQDAPSRAQQIVYKNDILFSTVRTYMKNIALINNEIYDGQIASSGFCVIRGSKEIIFPKFIFYYVISEGFLRPLNELQTGSSYPAVRDKDVFAQLFPFPPKEVQKNIVSKVEELFSELDKGIENMRKAQLQLKIYRQAVLKCAFEGKLTNENAKNGVLPKGWKNIRLGEIVDKVFDGPFGSNLKSIDYKKEGVRVIRLENIGILKFKDEFKTFVSHEKYLSIIRHTVSAGDIIFSSFIIGEIRVVILPKHIQMAINKADCFCIRTLPQQMLNNYLVYFLSTKNTYNQLIDGVHGATRPRINTTQLKSCLVPFCPIKEQDKIVQEIESRLSVADKLEESITQSLQQADALRQSILKKAFTGKLIKHY